MLSSYKEKYEHCFSRFVDISRSMFGDIERLEKENKELKTSMNQIEDKHKAEMLGVLKEVHDTYYADDNPYELCDILAAIHERVEDEKI